MKCWVCKHIYHVYCGSRSSDENIGTKTMVKTFLADSTKNNFSFACDHCKTHVEILVANDNAVAVNDNVTCKGGTTNDVGIQNEEKISDLTNKVGNMEKRFEEKLDTIMDLLTNKPAPEQKVNNKPSTNSLVASTSSSTDNVWNNSNGVGKVKALKSILIIKNKEGDIDRNTEKHIEKAVVDNNINIEGSYKNKDGNMVVICNGTDSRTILNDVIGDNKNLETKTPTRKSVSITIVGLREEYEKEKIVEMIMHQNGFIKGFIETNNININDHIEISAIRPLKNNENIYQAFARVSDALHSGLSHFGNRVTIGLSSCRIYNQYFVKRCYNCQHFGHFMKDCPTSDEHTCGKCSGNHKTMVCETGTLKCVNCMRENLGNVGHETNDKGCPCIQKQQEQIKLTQNNRLNSRRKDQIPLG